MTPREHIQAALGYLACHESTHSVDMNLAKKHLRAALKFPLPPMPDLSEGAEYRMLNARIAKAMEEEHGKASNEAEA